MKKGTAAAILRCAKEKYCAQGTWVLAEGFNSFLGNVLHSEGWPSEGRVAMLRLVKIIKSAKCIVTVCKGISTRKHTYLYNIQLHV